jgi:hypothetical protein
MAKYLFPHCSPRICFFYILGCILLLFPKTPTPAQDDFTNVEVPLSTTTNFVQFDKILSSPVSQIITNQRFAVLLSARSAWIMRAAGKPVPLGEFAALPPGFDWYERGCVAGNRIAIGVANYSKKQEQEDESKQRGDFVMGPEPAGVLVVNLDTPSITLVAKYRVISRPPGTSLEDVPKVITPGLESCLWSGSGLYVGDFGHLFLLDLSNRTAEVIQFDGPLGISKTSLWKEPGALWYTADSGGAEGTWVVELKGETERDYSPLNYYLTCPDSILRFNGRLLISSMAGVIEINTRSRRYYHYKLSEDKSEMAVHGLSAINGGLWGTTEYGWVKFDLDRKAASIFRLEGLDVSNNIEAVGFFSGRWFVGTDRELARVR